MISTGEYFSHVRLVCGVHSREVKLVGDVRQAQLAVLVVSTAVDIASFCYCKRMVSSPSYRNPLGRQLPLVRAIGFVADPLDQLCRADIFTVSLAKLSFVIITKRENPAIARHNKIMGITGSNLSYQFVARRQDAAVFAAFIHSRNQISFFFERDVTRLIKVGGEERLLELDKLGRSFDINLLVS